MCRKLALILILASIAIFASAQRGQYTYTGSVATTSSVSSIYVTVYCAGSQVIYSQSLYSYDTSPYTASLVYSSYIPCVSMLSNGIDDPFTIIIGTYSSDPQNITIYESELFKGVSGAFTDFSPYTAITMALFPGYVSPGNSYVSYNFTVAVIGSQCGDGIRQPQYEECDGYVSGCNSASCTCYSGYYADTQDTSNVYCLSSPYDSGSSFAGTSWLAVFLGIFIPIFVIILVLSIVMRVLFIRGAIACCGVRRPRTTIQTVTVNQPATTTTTTTTTAVVQGQPYPQPGVTEVAYYPQQPQQYPPQQQYSPQQGHVVPPQQHVMQYPQQQQQYPPQQPNVDGPVVPPQQYAPQPYPNQPTPYGYPGGNAPGQGGYVVYSPPPQGGAFQPQDPPK